MSTNALLTIQHVSLISLNALFWIQHHCESKLNATYTHAIKASSSYDDLIILSFHFIWKFLLILRTVYNMTERNLTNSLVQKLAQMISEELNSGLNNFSIGLTTKYIQQLHMICTHEEVSIMTFPISFIQVR